MKKYLKWFTAAVSGIVLLIVIASIAICFLLPLNKIKDFAASALSKQLHREVKIKSVSLNIFSGIKLKGLTIGNRQGFANRPFISASSIELRYAFWPIFQKKLIIPEATLVKPEILVEKSSKGDFNFSDIFSQKEEKQVKPADAGKKGFSIDFIIDTFSIKNGKITYLDNISGGQNELKDINVKISGITLSLFRPINFSASALGTYQGKSAPIKLAGNVIIDLPSEAVKIPNLLLSIAGESLSADIQIKKWADISLSLSSDKLSLDPFLALFAAAPAKDKKAKPVPGALTKSLEMSAAAIPQDLVFHGSVDFKNISFSHLKLDSLKMGFELKKRTASLEIKELAAYNGELLAKGVINLPLLSYNLGKLELKRLDASPLLNDVIDSFLPNMLDMKNKVEGTLDVSLSVKGSGVEMPSVFDNLQASGIVLLSDGRLKKLKSLESIGEKYGLNFLKQDMMLRGLRAEISLKDKKLDVKRLTVQNTDVQVAFSGGLDFTNMEYIKGNKLTLIFSPDISRELPKELSVFKDEKGIASIDFELQGPLSKPIPSPILTKPLETVVGKLKVKVEAKKYEIETKASEEVKKIEEEAKKKVKEILKF
jgi:uncharacterized protein involved in outer membrane biogenesis